jgi:UDP-2-acetamido-2,6-beta-L-arabino-hexul-4-ose reductase
MTDPDCKPATRVLITGPQGFVGRNLVSFLVPMHEFLVLPVPRGASEEELVDAIQSADCVVHLAGTNRPRDPAEFVSGNGTFTERLCDLIKKHRPGLPVAFTSSIQATAGNAYGDSKLQAEKAILRYGQQCSAATGIFRLPNVFGKWCRPNYNSVVATFCYNLTRGLPTEIHDPARILKLVYVDDVVESLVKFIRTPATFLSDEIVQPIYEVFLGRLHEILSGYNAQRKNLQVASVGSGLERALYATWLSYLPPEDFSYPVAAHSDARGTFVEMLKTPTHGQVSFFTAKPGVTRGGHYHHTKNEKFLVIQGRARFDFQHIQTKQLHTLDVCGSTPHIVDTVPGWFHAVTNTGDEDLIVLLWANEVFDRSKPDTFPYTLSPPTHASP